jgi:hypothetical protein
MAQAIERLLATPKTIPYLPAKEVILGCIEKDT